MIYNKDTMERRSVMNLLMAREEYAQALRQGQKEVKALTAAGKSPYPAVLDQILPEHTYSTQELGILEIPAERIVGVTTAGRITAFSAGFLPLLGAETEFAAKWTSLCADHLGDTGIREPILCHEYLGNFYVQEGNKRVSVLRHFGSPRIAATVRRILPPPSDDPRVQAYYEFLEFYRDTGMYTIQYRSPGDYEGLLSHLGKEPGEPWDERERRTFQSNYFYFREAYNAQKEDFGDLLPEEALLLWLQVYPFRALGQMTSGELKKSVASLKEELKAQAKGTPVEVHLEPTKAKASLLNLLNPVAPEYVRVAFVHALHPDTSQWIADHDRGRQYLEEVLGEQVRVRSYFNGDSPAHAEALMEKAVTEGAQVVFTTTPQLSRATFRMAVKYPRVKFLNCAVNRPYSSLRSYYGRIFEAKFITGAIAGAMADGNSIGYIGNSPILGVPAAINAFALGAQMTNPRAKVSLRWSCLPGSPQEDFLREGIRVISNRDTPARDANLLDGFGYGTYYLDEENLLQPLASPVWVWGKFYEAAVRAVLNGTWEKSAQAGKAVNYWWGMESGLIDICLSTKLPEGVAVLAKTLRQAIIDGTLQPFCREIVAQDGTVKNDGSRNLTADELLHMDWLCENVEGYLPEFSEIIPVARPLVREQGIFRDQIPKEKEGSL